jgi:hypothetical protein
MVEKELMIRRRMEMNPESDQIMAGITAIPTGNMVPMEQMAGGGIVAFSQGGNKGVESIKDASQARQSYREQLEREVLESMKRLKTEDPFKESRAQDEQIRAQMAESKRVSPYEALTMAGLRTMAGTSQYGLSNLGAGGEEGVKALARAKREEADLQKQLLQQGVEREKSQFGRQAQLLGAQQTALGQLYGKEAEIERARAAKSTAGESAQSRAFNQAQIGYLDAIDKARKSIAANNKYNELTDAQIDSMARESVNANLSPQFKKILFGDTNMFNAPAAAAPAASSGTKSSTAPVKVNTIQERDKLPKGTIYIDPNGVTRTKS